MKGYGLYLWKNEKLKMWTVTNEEDETLINIVENKDVKEYIFKTTRDRMDYEKHLNDDGYLYCSYETFLI